MRLHTGQQQQQHPHHQQQYCAIDNCLKQQQHFTKNLKNLQQQTGAHLQQPPNYHQHHLQQHVLQQQQPPPTHMWNPHLSAACFSSQPPTGNTNSVNNVNLHNCRPFHNNRVYQHPAHGTHYPQPNLFPHTIPASSPASERIGFTAPNYAKLPPISVVNQQRINECAGIPLISTATAHLTPGHRQRISRKQSHSPPAKNWSNMLHSTAVQNYAAVAHYAAAHAQGAPLMLNKPQQQNTEYWSPNAYASSNNQQQQQQFTGNALQYNSKQQGRTRTPLRYQNSAPASLTSSKSKENLEQQLKHPKDNENSSSNNGDSSNSNETCLPRIIKPRKRRKKDRKPPGSLVNAVYLKMDHKIVHDKSSDDQVNKIKSYKSSEDSLKCLQKFNQITQINEHEQRSNKTGPIFDILCHNGKEHTAHLTRCTAGSNINHGICFCNECDPLRSLWDYPLRRSLSDSSASDTSGTGSLCDTNSSTSSMEFPSKSDYNWPKARAEIVGVIGSKRNKDQQSCSYNTKYFGNNNNNNYNNNNNDNNNMFNNNILSGINLANELFKHTNCSTFANLDNDLTAPNNMILLPETAETLLTKSINEISKKLIETCSNESCDLTLSSCHSLSSFSNTSSNSSSANSTCADFSNDSGIESAHINARDDLVFNFDNLHITTTKLSLSPSSSLSSASLSSSSSSSSSSSTSSCGNLSMSSSPTVKFASNFLTTQALSLATAASTTTTTTPTMQKATPLTPSNVVMGTTVKAAPTLDILVDLNNNHLQAMIVTENEQLQQQLQRPQFNDLVQNHQPPQQQQEQQEQKQQMQQQQHQHDQQFFNNCFDLMWQQHERQLGGNSIITTTTTTATSTSTTTNTRNSIDQLTSSDLTSNNVAMSSFYNSVGSLKAIFSTIS